MQSSASHSIRRKVVNVKFKYSDRLLSELMSSLLVNHFDHRNIHFLDIKNLFKNVEVNCFSAGPIDSLNLTGTKMNIRCADMQKY